MIDFIKDNLWQTLIELAISSGVNDERNLKFGLLRTNIHAVNLFTDQILKKILDNGPYYF